MHSATLSWRDQQGNCVCLSYRKVDIGPSKWMHMIQVHCGRGILGKLLITAEKSIWVILQSTLLILSYKKSTHVQCAWSRCIVRGSIYGKADLLITAECSLGHTMACLSTTVHTGRGMRIAYPAGWEIIFTLGDPGGWWQRLRNKFRMGLPRNFSWLVFLDVHFYSCSIDLWPLFPPFIFLCTVLLWIPTFFIPGWKLADCRYCLDITI